MPSILILALLGTFRRIANAIVLGVGVVVGLVALEALGDAHYLTAFKTDQMQAIARQLLAIHGAHSSALCKATTGISSHRHIAYEDTRRTPDVTTRVARNPLPIEASLARNRDRALSSSPYQPELP